jgi:predicted  nucleic acid-binding Zn-ribbon protein
MSTHKHRVLPVSDDLDDTVELPSLPAALDGPTDTWVAPQLAASDLAASAVTEEMQRPVLPTNLSQVLPQPAPAPLQDAVARAQEVAAHAAALKLANEAAAAHAAGQAASLVRLKELDQELATRVEQHRLGEAERDDLRARLERVQAELASVDKVRERQSLQLSTQQQDWERERTQRESALVRAQGDLAELRRQSAAHSEALQHVEGQRHLYDAMFREREALVDERDARLAAQASELAAARAQLDSVRAETSFARDETARAQAQCAAQQARAGELNLALARAQEAASGAQQRHEQALGQVAGLERDAADHGEALRLLHEQLRAAQLAIEALRGDLAAAEDLIRTHENEQQQRAARIARLESNETALRAKLANAERGLAAEGAASGAQPTLDGQMRLLVRSEGDTGIVHLLRRTTTIGRTPDNDVCIDAEFISRHHAVVLVAASGTVLEDLNSTNGVYVNGVRVSRQQLAEGDLVTIGKTGFRYILKPQAEAAGHPGPVTNSG